MPLRLRRPLTMVLHWSTALSLLAVMALGGDMPVWATLWYGTSALAFAASGAVLGLMGRAGPRLTGLARAALPWTHRGLYALAAWSGAACLAPQFATSLAGPDPFTLVLLTFAAMCLHTLFHIWRESVVHDAAFRRMLPKVFFA